MGHVMQYDAQWVMGYGLWVMSCSMMHNGLWVMRYVMQYDAQWVVGYGLCDAV